MDDIFFCKPLPVRMVEEEPGIQGQEGKEEERKKTRKATLSKVPKPRRSKKTRSYEEK